MVYRLTRYAAGAEGLGRAKSVYERLADTRLAGVHGEGTKLIYRVRDPHAWATDPIAEVSTARFWTVIEGLIANLRPEFVTPPISVAVSRFAAALIAAAEAVKISVDGQSSPVFTTAAIDRGVWNDYPAGGTETGLAGRL